MCMVGFMLRCPSCFFPVVFDVWEDVGTDVTDRMSVGIIFNVFRIVEFNRYTRILEENWENIIII